MLNMDDDEDNGDDDQVVVFISKENKKKIGEKTKTDREYQNRICLFRIDICHTMPDGLFVSFRCIQPN